MEKNVFQGFEGSKLDDQSTIKGGYFYEPTLGKGFSDEYLITEPGETYGGADPNSSCNHQDGSWQC